MNTGQAFHRALIEIQVTDPADSVPDQLARVCTTVLDVQGAGLSYTLLPDRRLPLGADDSPAAAAERLQYATGEGPCYLAQRSRARVVAALPLLMTRWPVFAAQLQAHTPFRSVIALPVGGPLAGVVALDLYRHDPTPPTPDLLTDITDMADLVGAALAEDLAGDEDYVVGLPSSLRTLPATARHRVWLAIGHLSGRSAVTTPDALALLRATAFTHDLTLETTADRILSGELPVPDPV